MRKLLFVIGCICFGYFQGYSQNNENIYYSVEDVSGIWYADSLFVNELDTFIDFPKESGFSFGFSDQKASIGGYKFVGMYHPQNSDAMLLYFTPYKNIILIYDRQGVLIYYLTIEKLIKEKVMIATMKSAEEFDTSQSRIKFAFGKDKANL